MWAGLEVDLTLAAGVVDEGTEVLGLFGVVESVGVSGFSWLGMSPGVITSPVEAD